MAPELCEGELLSQEYVHLLWQRLSCGFHTKRGAVRPVEAARLTKSDFEYTYKFFSSRAKAVKEPSRPGQALLTSAGVPPLQRTAFPLCSAFSLKTFLIVEKLLSAFKPNPAQLLSQGDTATNPPLLQKR